MTKLTCHVDNCISNCNHCCCLGKIDVNGSNASCCRETSCRSFVKKQPGQMNNAVDYAHADPNCQIRCSASQCVYNQRGSCTASDISIDGIGAQGCGDTSCASFKAR